MKLVYKLLFLFFVVIFFINCNNKKNDVDVCKCLTEPGNSEYMKENENACRDAISKELGVENWEKINMSQNPDVSLKFDALSKRCQ